MRPLLVGESNPYSPDPRHALLCWPPGSAGNRLCVMLGWTTREYLGAFERLNLCGPGPWRVRAARESAAAMLELWGPWRREIILLGARVAAAFDQAAIPPWQQSGRFIRLPHPSGRSRAWNEPGARERLRELLASYRPKEVRG